MRGNRRYFDKVSGVLRGHPAVRAVRVNPVTGTALIEHGGPIEAIFRFAAENGLFALGLAGEEPEATLLPDMPAPPPESVLAVLFALIGIYSAARGRVLGNAFESLWNGYQLAKLQGRSGWAAGFFAMGAIQLLRGRAQGQASSFVFHALNAHHMAKRQARHGAG
jgi:hypothetical protein